MPENSKGLFVMGHFDYLFTRQYVGFKKRADEEFSAYNALALVCVMVFVYPSVLIVLGYIDLLSEIIWETRVFLKRDSMSFTMVIGFLINFSLFGYYTYRYRSKSRKELAREFHKITKEERKGHNRFWIIYFAVTLALSFISLNFIIDGNIEHGYFRDAK